MLPLKYTTMANSYDTIASTAQITKFDLNPLIDLDEDSEESSDNTSLSGDSSTYWAPKGGNLSILQRDLINGIANLTGCIFCPEPEHKRMRLVSGNTQTALAKLRRLEPLLVSILKDTTTFESLTYNIRNNWRDTDPPQYHVSITISFPCHVRPKVPVFATYLPSDVLMPNELLLAQCSRIELSLCSLERNKCTTRAQGSTPEPKISMLSTPRRIPQ